MGPVECHRFRNHLRCPICLGQNRNCTRVYKNLKNHKIRQHGAAPDPHYKRQQAWQARMRKLRAERRLIAYAHVLLEAFGDQ